MAAQLVESSPVRNSCHDLFVQVIDLSWAMPRRSSWPLLCGVLVVTMVVMSWRVTTEESPHAEVSIVEGAATPEVLAGPLSTSPTPATSTTTTPSVTAPPSVPPRAVVEAAERAAVPGMRLNVAVLDLTTGELVEGGNGRQPVYSASLSKLILVVDMLDRRRLDGIPIDESDFRLVGRALSRSDDGAMNALWSLFDGRGAIGRVAGRLGLTGTRAPSDQSQWGETMVSAGDLARIYGHILRDMPADDRRVITDALIATEHTAPDGFDQFFGLLAHGPSERVYAKQGWVGYRQGYYLHSAGVVENYAIVLLSVQAAAAPTARQRLSTVATAAISAAHAP